MRDQDTGKAGKKGAARSAPARSSATPAPAPSADPTGILTLQRSIGNAAVVQLLADAGDPHSQERHEHGPGCGHGAAAPVQRSEVQSVLSSPGRPLDAPTRTEMESRLGADFSDVRLHTGGAARRSAAEIGARAYTSGSHVVIGDGGADKHTLAHELTHVIQQRRGPVAGTDDGSGLKVSDPSDRFEREAEANATRALGTPPAPETTAAGTAGTTATPDSVQRAAAAGPDGGQIQRAGATGLRERSKAAAKKGADKVDKAAGTSAPPANFMAGGFSTGGNTPGDFGRASGIGAAAIVGGALAVPDMVTSVLKVCSRFSAWRHAAAGEESTEALKELLKACAEAGSNSSAVSGGVAGGVGTITGSVAQGVGGGALGIVSGLYAAIHSSVEAYESHKKKAALKKTDLPAKNFKKLLEDFQKLERQLDDNHELLVQNLKAQHKLDRRQLPATAAKAEELAMKARHDDRSAAVNTRYDVAKATVQDTIAECREAAGLQAAKDLGIRKTGRKTVRGVLTALAGTLSVPASALSIVAVVLGLSAGAIPIAGWAIAGVVGMITAGVLTWKLVNKVRANMKAMASDDTYKDESQWGIFFEAMKVWKPKADSSRDRAAQTLYEGLTSQSSANKTGAEALVKALSLDPAQLLKAPDAKDAIAAIKGRLAST